MTQIGFRVFFTVAALAGCGETTFERFDHLPESERVATAAWPRLVETPRPAPDLLPQSRADAAKGRLYGDQTAAQQATARALAIPGNEAALVAANSGAAARTAALPPAPVDATALSVAAARPAPVGTPVDASVLLARASRPVPVSGAGVDVAALTDARNRLRAPRPALPVASESLRTAGLANQTRAALPPEPVSALSDEEAALLALLRARQAALDTESAVEDLTDLRRAAQSRMATLPETPE